MIETAADIASTLISEPPQEQPVGRTFAEVLNELKGCIEEGRPVVQVLRSGWSLIDDTVGGLVCGEYLGLIGGSGVGKSTLADQIVLDTLLQNSSAQGIIFALETATEMRVARLLADSCVWINESSAIIECVPIQSLLRGKLGETGVRHAIEGVERLARKAGDRLRFIDTAITDTQIAQIIVHEEPDVVLIDHLGLVVTDAGTDSATARMDDTLALLIAALRASNAAGIIVNELNKSALLTGRTDLMASRGSARFASLASTFVALSVDPPLPGARDPIVRATLLKSRFGPSHKEQLAQFFGGLAYFHWGPVQEVEYDHPSSKRRRKPVSRDGADGADSPTQEEDDG